MTSRSASTPIFVTRPAADSDYVADWASAMDGALPRVEGVGNFNGEKLPLVAASGRSVRPLIRNLHRPLRASASNLELAQIQSSEAAPSSKVNPQSDERRSIPGKGRLSVIYCVAEIRIANKTHRDQEFTMRSPGPAATVCVCYFRR